jgi:hypothetical protein
VPEDDGEGRRSLRAGHHHRALQPHLAWELGRPLNEIETAHGRGVVFKSWRERLAGKVHVWGQTRRCPLMA